MKKFLTALFALLLFISVCPVQNIKAGTLYTASDIYDGEGTEESPFILTNVEDINKLSFLSDEEQNTYYFKLADSFNDTTAITSPIKCDQLKCFDGNNKTIIIDIEADTNNIGLFNSIECCTIKNITIKGKITQTDNEFNGGCTVFGTYIDESIFTNVHLDVEIDNAGQFSCGFAGSIQLSTFTNCTIKNKLSCSTISCPLYLMNYESTFDNCDYSQVTLVSPVIGDLYTADSANTMAYRVNDENFDVLFNLGFYRMVSFLYRGFETTYETEAEEPDLDIDIACEFIPGKSTIKVTLTYTNNMESELTFIPRINCDTAIDGNDGSANAVQNNILLMSSNGVTLFATTTDEGFNILPIEYDYLDCDLDSLEVETDAEDSAVVMYWDETTLQTDESKTYTVYIGMTDSNDATSIASQMGKPQ